MKLSDLDDGHIIEHLATKEDLLALEVKLSNMFHTELANLHGELLNLSGTFHKEVVGLIKWFVVILMGFATLILGGVYFMLAHVLKP